MTPPIRLKPGWSCRLALNAGGMTIKFNCSKIYNSIIYRHFTCPVGHRELTREAFVSKVRVEKFRIKCRETDI